MKSSTFLFGLVALTTGAAAAAADATRPPNIVFIVADDLGYADIGPFGQQKIHTPNLDRFAAEGTRFTNYYAGGASGAPSACAVMMGQDTGHGSVRDERGHADVAHVAIASTEVTVASVLGRSNYISGGVGKWSLGNRKSGGEASQQGFDFFVGYLNPDDASNHYPEKIIRWEKPAPVPANAKGRHGRYADDIFADEAAGFIKAHRNKAFFLYAVFTIPHADWTVPADALREYADAFSDDPPIEIEGRKVERPRATYAAMVTRLDGYVGRILAQLRESGLDDNTIVFFSGDSGAANPGGLGEFFDSHGPFRGWKGSLNEGGIRAPMLVRWPGHVPAGRVSDFAWAGWDFLPTAAALAGVEHVPTEIDGISIVPALLGKEQRPHDYLYWEIPAKKSFAQAVRVGELKAIRRAPDQPVAVYNIGADPGETRDLAAAEPKFVAQARELFRRARTPNENYPTPEP